MADSGPKGSNESTDALTQAVSGLTIDILNDKNDCTESSSESTPSSSSSNDVTTTITVYDNGDGSISRTATSTAAVTTQQQVHATQHHKQGGIVKLIQDVTNQFEWKHKPKTEKKPIGESGDLYRDLNAIIDMILHNVRVCSLYLPGQHVRTLLLLLVRLGKRDGFDYDFSRFGGEGYVRDFESFKSLLFRIRADCSSDSENGNENGADGSEKGETNKEIFEKLFKSMPNGNTDLVDRLDVYLQRYYDLEHIDKDLLRASGDFFHAAHSSRGANAFIRSPQDAIDLALQLESITKVLKEYFGTDLDRNLADRTGSFVGDDISGSDDHETGGASALPRFTAAQCYVQQVFSRKMRDCARLLFRFCNYLEVESGGSDPTQMAGGRRAHAMKSLRRLRQSPALRSSVTKAMKAILGLLDIVSHFVRAGNSDGVVDAYGLSSFQKRYAANLERHNEEGRSSHASDVLGSVLDRSVKELQDEVDTRNTKESDGTDLTERRARSSVLKYLLKQKFKYTQRLNTYLVYDGEDALDGTPASLLAVRSASSARKCQVNTNAGAGSTTGNALAVASDSTPHDRVSPGGVSQETGADAKAATDDVDDNDHAGVSADQAYAYVFKTLTSQLHPEEGVEKKKRRVVVKRKDLPNKNNNGTSNDSHDDEVNDDENVHHRGSGGDEVEFQDSESDNNNHTPGLRFNVQLSTNFVKATRSIHEFMNTLDKEWAKYDRNSNTSDAEHSPSPLEIKAQAHRAHALDDAVERFFEDKAATQGQIEGRRFVMNLLQRVIRRVDPGWFCALSNSDCCTVFDSSCLALCSDLPVNHAYQR